MPSNPLTDPDWAVRSVDFIDRIVATIRRYSTSPLLKTARGLVFGLLASIGVISAFALVCIGLARGLQSALDAAVDHSTSVWISYFILSAVFLLVGVVLLRRRHSPTDNSND